MDRVDFFNLFSKEEMLNQLTIDDRIEIFSSILAGSSDFSKKLLDRILSDYSVEHLEVKETSKC